MVTDITSLEYNGSQFSVSNYISLRNQKDLMKTGQNKVCYLPTSGFFRSHPTARWPTKSSRGSGEFPLGKSDRAKPRIANRAE